MIKDQIFFHQKFIAFELDDAQNIIELTPAAEQFIGRSQRMVQNQPIGNFITLSAELENILRSEKNISIYDQQISTIFGAKFKGDFHVELRDGTSLIWLYSSGNNHLRERSDAARNATKVSSAMAAMLSHEIRNPLGSIKGAAQLLADNMSAQDLELISVIDEEAGRISRLVGEFEEMAGSTPPSIEQVNIHKLIDQVKRAAKAGYAQNIFIEENYDPSLPHVHCDPDRMSRALHNVLKNAAEAVSLKHEGQIDRGRISILTRFRTGHRRSNGTNLIEICIKDNGGGIAQSLSDDVFKPFVTTKSQGTGLGLSIVARSIEEIGGVVEVDSNDQGCEIRFYLPIDLKTGEM